MLGFRYYLRSSTEAMNRNVSTKLSLKAKYPDNYNDYSHGKNEVIAELLAEATAWWQRN